MPEPRPKARKSPSAKGRPPLPFKTEMLTVRRLKRMAAPYNPRTIDDDELERLRLSLREHGCCEPVVANKRTGRVVGGHQRVRAAELEGFDHLPVVWVDKDETGERQLNLALNRISGRWDYDALAAVLQDLRDAGASTEIAGFPDAEVSEILAMVAPPDVTPPDAFPNLDPGNVHVTYKCPRCKYEWSGSPD